MYAHLLRPPQFGSFEWQKVVNPLIVCTMVYGLFAQALPQWTGAQQMPAPLATLETPAAATAFRSDALPTLDATPITASQSDVAPQLLFRNGYPEIVERRDAYSRHYDLGNGRDLAIVSTEPQNYQDASGQWLPQNSRFEEVVSGYVLAQDELQSSLGKSSSTALIRRGETLLGWQPQTLLALDTDGEPVETLAQPIALLGEGDTRDAAPDASLSSDGSTITYRNHWSDNTLGETFVSAPGSIEQSLVFATPPTLGAPPDWPPFLSSTLKQAAAAFPLLHLLRPPPKWLAFETDLYLFSGESLWVDGREQADRFSTIDSDSQTLEVRNSAGKPVLALSPVIAYEQAHPSTSVAGHYEGERLEENIWRLRLLTPWDWWANPARAYPAVLDPTIYMQVKQATTLESTSCFNPADNALAIPPCDTFDYLFFGEQTQTDDEGELLGYTSMGATITFEQLPTLPPGYTINAASLVLDGGIEASGGIYGNNLEVELLDDGASLGSYTISHDVNLNEASEPRRNCYNLFQNPNCTAKPVSMTAEIPLPVSLIQQWYAGDNQGIGLGKDGSSVCESVLAHTDFDGAVVECSFTSHTQPQLIIEYDAPTLGNGYIFSAPIPSYDQDVFARSEHEYELDPLDSPWLAVAAKGEGDDDAVSLRLNMRTDFDVDRAPVLDDPVKGDQVNYVVIDDSAGQLNGLQSWVEVGGWDDNSASDTYKLEQHSSVQLPKPTLNGVKLTQGLAHGVMSLYHFAVEPDWNLFISVTAASDLNVGLELFPQNPGMGSHIQQQFDGRGGGFLMATPWEQDNGTTRYSVEAATEIAAPETWALAVTHDYLQCSTGPSCESIEIELIACPKGTYFTDKWGCQSLIYPHSSILPEGGNASDDATASAAIPATQSEEVSQVRIFSEGGFDHSPTQGVYGANAGAYAFCTAHENLGMPLLGLTEEDAVPVLPAHSGPQRLIAVRQGSICVTDGGKIEIVGGNTDSDYGAITGPSFRHDARIPAPLYDGNVQLYHGEMINAFGGLYPYNFGAMHQAGDPLVLLPNDNNAAHVAPWGRPKDDPPAWPDMATTSQIVIGQRAVAGEDHGIIHVASDTPGSTTDIPTDASWTIAGDFAAQRFTFAAQTPMTPPNLEMASLGLRFHAPATLLTTFADQVPQKARIEELHLTDATVHQSELMGGAYRPIQAVVLPAHTMRLDGVECGTLSCLDLRNASNIDSAEWQMPDVDAGGPTGSVLFQSAGNLQLFSNDHPDSGKVAAAAGLNSLTAGNAGISQSFNFKTFSGKVSIAKEACITKGDPGFDEDEEYPEVTVVRGFTSLGLPSLGDGSSSGPGFSGEFKLCQTQLREVKLTFNAFPPGISAGPSGMLIKRIEGTVWINPEFVRIQLGVTFQSADGVTYSNGGAQMIIDTRGYFELSGGARLVAVFDVHGALKVAWNPLDILQEAELKYRDWLRGYLRLHVWRGQGWQNAYDWLPDNNDFHFTGAIGAELTLKKGRIGQFFGVSLPRHDIVFGVEIAFGEFCRNDACTSYEWGVQGKITVLSFTVGMFVGKRSGLDFFVGDKGHVLIDQAFDSAVAVAQNASVNASAAVNNIPSGLVSDLADGATIDFGEDTAGPCPLEDGVAVCTFTVEPQTGEAFISVSWSEGTLPTTILYTPGGTAVSGNALSATPMQLDNVLGNTPVQAWRMSADGDIQFTLDATGALYTIVNPQPGEWKVRLADLTGNEYYNVLFAANSPPPQLALTSPNDVQVDGSLDIQWTASSAPVGATVRLAYISESEYISYTQGLAANVPTSKTLSYVGGTTFAPAVDAAGGSYQWQVAGLASGSYYIVARIDHPVYGSIYAFSPGPFTYVDNTPPAAPTGLMIRGQEGTADGLILSWARSSDADLSAYEVIYNSPSLDDPSGFVERRLRILPTNPRMTNPTRESTRLVGLLENVETTVCVRAVDASGNMSECSLSLSATPRETGYAFWTKPDLTTLQSQPAGPTLFAQWNAGIGSDGYLLSWGYACGGALDGPPANQGQSNLDVGSATNIGLTGLPPGTYTLAVRGYKSSSDKGLKQVISQIGAYSNMKRVVLSDGVDSDGDGLPDDWAEHFGVHGLGDDPDNDNVNNHFELIHGTDPTLADSDGDTFTDGEELFAGLTDACDQNSMPDSEETVRLVVEPEAESLRYNVVADQGSSAGQTILVSAVGNDAIDWTATPSAPWIKVSPAAGDDLSWTTSGEKTVVSVNASGLEPGYYEGNVRITGSRPGKPVYTSPQTVPVRMWVMRYGAKPKTIIEGYVFLDENGNGVEDGGETVRIGNVMVEVVNRMGAVMQSTQSMVNSGAFVMSQLPYASYSLVATHPDPAFVVTTLNPLPVQLTKEQSLLTLIKIGMAYKPDAKPPLTDRDGDGISDQEEDHDRDGNPNNDDTDRDGTPDYRDTDDDDDGVFTRLEGRGDHNNDGIPDYLDPKMAVMRQGGVFLPGIGNALPAGTSNTEEANAPEATPTPTSAPQVIYLPNISNE